MLDAARGWLTPGVLFVLVNLVVATIAVASKLMPQAPEDAAADDERRRGGLLRAPSLAINRLRSTFSFSRYGLAAADNAPLLFDDAAAVGVNQDPSSPHTPPPAVVTGTWAPEVEAEEHGSGEEAARVERTTQSEAAAAAAGGDEMRRTRARRMRRAATEEEAALGRVAGRRGEEPPAVEVDARADDFIRRFREQLRVQRLDSILRYRETLRRTGTA